MVDGPNIGLSAPLIGGIETPSVKDRASRDAPSYPKRKKRPRPESAQKSPQPATQPDGTVGTRLNVLA